MKGKRIVLISLLLIVLASISIGAISAIDSEEIDLENTIATNNEIATDTIATNNEIATDTIATNNEIAMENTLQEESQDLQLENSEINEIESGESESLKEGQTITVDGSSYVQMSNPTIQNAIDSANDGDTIIITGNSYVHCHFIVNKKLTIISTVGTTMDTCPSNTRGSGSHGIFYISASGSGTIIEGFTFINNNENDDDYGVYVEGASNVLINNCTVQSVKDGNGIFIKDSTNVVINNSLIENSTNGAYIKNSNSCSVENSIFHYSKIGIKIEESNNTKAYNNEISNNTASGLAIDVKNTNTTISYNNISYNQFCGINISSAEYVDILSNNIFYNMNGDKNNYTTGAGIYINCNVTKINIKGNVVLQNGDYGVLSDYRVLNVNADKGAEKLIYTENNYFMGHGDRVVYHIKYVEASYGDFIYDETTDTYIHVGYGNGTHEIGKTVVYLGHTYYEHEGICGAILYQAPQTTFGGQDMYKYVLQKSEIGQVKKGVYNISIVDYEGNVATDFDNMYVIFYLNKNTSSSTPQDSDIYKIVKMNNGTATADLTSFAKFYKESGNIITASFPGITAYYKNNPYVEFAVDDNDIPGSYKQTRIIVKNTTLAPKSGDYFTATLVDSDGNPVANETVYFKLSTVSSTYSRTTDENGTARLKINLGTSTPVVTVSFNGSENYNKSSASAKLTIKKLTTTIISSNMELVPKSGAKFTIQLKDVNGKALANEKINLSIGKSSYSRTTNENGEASLTINLASFKTYTITSKYSGTEQYYGKTVSNTITIKAGANKVTLITNNITLVPKSGENFTATLIDSDGNPMANKTVYFKLSSSNTTYTRTTNENGMANLKINLGTIKTYTITTSYDGDAINSNASSVSKITIAKAKLILETYDRIFENNSAQYFHATLKDSKGNPVAGKVIAFTINSKTYNKTSDSNGVAKLKINIAAAKSYPITTSYAGDSQNNSVSRKNTITIVIDENKSFVDAGLNNDEIQRIINESPNDTKIEFLGGSYNNIALSINKTVNLYPKKSTVLNGIADEAVVSFIQGSKGSIIQNFIINPNSASAILVEDTESIGIINNTLKNQLDESLIDDYNNGSTLMPGEGISIINSSNIKLDSNDISLFESGVYLEDSDGISAENNAIHENNYGIKYGKAVANTNITNNRIIDNIGWYVMDVPEGPRGYGILFNESAVNVTVYMNNISNNYIGISVDSNNSTGIAIISNLIADNSLEGIRFNAAYDFAENAVQPYITDNAIYRNAEGPSLMILGELSANPEGIYGPGQWDDNLKLHIDANWYGANSLKTWDYDSGIVGVGTMCPRIKTTEIYFNNLTYQEDGTYRIDFYKNGTFDSNLASFDMFATLNRGTDKEEECHFMIENGTGIISFDSSSYNSAGNNIEISVGSLKDTADRIYTVFFSYEIPENEIPA